MKVTQRDIIFINYELPNGDYQPHLALVLSNDDINEYEGYYLTVMLSFTPVEDNYTYLVSAEMFNFDFKARLKSPQHKPQVRCHLISAIREDELFISKRFGTIKQAYYDQIVQQISEVVFGRSTEIEE